MHYSSTGKLIVRIATAGGALPVPGAVIRVRGATEENREIDYSLLSDADGVCDALTLPCPDASYSLSPGANEDPFSTYDLEISLSGYYRKNITGVAVFSGISSLQTVLLIPFTPFSTGITYPRGNLLTESDQNPELLKGGEEK